MTARIVRLGISRVDSHIALWRIVLEAVALLAAWALFASVAAAP